MKLFAAALLLSSVSALAIDVCEYRFNSRLAVTVEVKDRFADRLEGGIIWDDKNVCAGDLCTEIYPGKFKVKYRDLTPPRTQGIVIFNVRAISVKDDLGNRFRRNSLFGDFIRNAKFVTVVYPDPNLTFRWKGRTRAMKCRETE